MDARNISAFFPYSGDQKIKKTNFAKIYFLSANECTEAAHTFT